MQSIPTALVNRTGRQSYSTLGPKAGPLYLQLPSAMKVGCSGHGMLLEEEAEAETSVALEGVSGCRTTMSTTVHE